MSSTINGNVTTEATLNAAIVTADGETVAGIYTIDISGTILETTDLKAINLATGVSLVINGGGGTLNGEGDQRGLFVYAGTVDISDLTIANAHAVGGKGGNGSSGGGGGAGLGGGLFVASGANVTLAATVGFLSDAATGGNGGTTQTGRYSYGGGGGGLGWSGGNAAAPSRPSAASRSPILTTALPRR